MMQRKLAAGNWKMNGLGASLTEVSQLSTAKSTKHTDILICPPATLLSRAGDAVKDSQVMIGGQDCHSQTTGAHTGDVSAEMLADAGATAVILGHSERREDHAESNASVCDKTRSAWAAGLTAIVCLGESLAQREDGSTLTVVGTQLAESVPDQATADTLVVAYEPIWAIGTGKVPTLEQIGEVHNFMRAQLCTRFGTEVGAAIRLLYGGSVKPTNAPEIFGVSNVDGALVGGASLKASDFQAIIDALDAA